MKTLKIRGVLDYLGALDIARKLAAADCQRALVARDPDAFAAAAVRRAEADTMLRGLTGCRS